MNGEPPTVPLALVRRPISSVGQSVVLILI